MSECEGTEIKFFEMENLSLSIIVKTANRESPNEFLNT